MKYVQAELTDEEYMALKDVAAGEHISIKEALRKAALRWTRERTGQRDPLLEIIGSAEGTQDASDRVDEMYRED